MSQEVEISRKVSILSILSANYEEKRKSLSPYGTKKEPKDPFYLIHSCCFFLGFMNVMPLMFFSTAAAYWMYKFRDPTVTADTTQGSDRTSLQSYFQPLQMAASTFPSIIFSIIYTLYGHKLSAMLRLIWSLAIMAALFLLFSVFTQIDTDQWQTGFFIVTICLVLVNSMLTCTLQMATPIIIAKLPHKYMFSFLLGQNGTFISTILQVISLSVTDYQPTSGLIYFSCGSVLIGFTLLLLLVSRMSEFFKYYDVEDIKQEKSESISWAECKEMIKKIWPCQFIIGMFILNMSVIHPSLTTLIVSEDEADETLWAKKYFTPICVFFISDFTSVLGRFAARRIFVTPSNKWWWISFMVLRLSLSVPFVVYCNAKPRNLPVLFGKDWEFIMFQALFGFTAGALMNSAFMSIRSLAENKQEVALKLLTLTFSAVGAATTVNGLFMVKILLL